jgi:uncharacterized protein (TIGR02246 family)
MRNVKYRVLTLAVVAMLPALGVAVRADQATQPAPQAAKPGAADPELQKLADTYAAAWGKGDAAALAALYTTDAIYIDSGLVLMTGRTEIEATFKLRFEGELKGTTITISPGQTRQIAPDVQMSEGAWQIAGGAARADAAPTAQPSASGAAASAGRYLNTYVRKQGHWMISGTAAVAEPPKAP